jgi:hypothetical protein
MEHPRRRKGDEGVTGEFCNRFGAVAVNKGLVTVGELKAAIMEQIDDDVNGREHRLLGSILYEKGLITEGQIEDVLLELKKILE